VQRTEEKKKKYTLKHVIYGRIQLGIIILISAEVWSGSSMRY